MGWIKFIANAISTGYSAFKAYDILNKTGMLKVAIEWVKAKFKKAETTEKTDK